MNGLFSERMCDVARRCGAEVASANTTGRIGCMGHSARPADVVLLLAAHREVFGR